MKNCVVPEMNITPRDYVLSAITFGSWTAWKQQEYYNAQKEYYKCVEEKFNLLRPKNSHTPSLPVTQSVHAPPSCSASPQ